MSARNAYEAAGRARKVARLVSVLDEALDEQRGAFEEPNAAADLVLVQQLPERAFVLAAMVAGVRPPSEATRAEIVQAYWRRAERAGRRVA